MPCISCRGFMPSSDYMTFKVVGSLITSHVFICYLVMGSVRCHTLQEPVREKKKWGTKWGSNFKCFQRQVWKLTPEICSLSWKKGKVYLVTGLDVVSIKILRKSYESLQKREKNNVNLFHFHQAAWPDRLDEFLQKMKGKVQAMYHSITIIKGHLSSAFTAFNLSCRFDSICQCVNLEQM